MSNYSKLYWLTRLDNIQSLFIAFVIISIILIIVYNAGYGIIDEYQEEKTKKKKDMFVKKYSWLCKAFIPLLLASMIVLTFLPSKKDMIIIYAGGKTMDYIQSDTSLSKIPYQTTSIISEYLDKQLKELKK